MEETAPGAGVRAEGSAGGVAGVLFGANQVCSLKGPGPSQQNRKRQRAGARSGAGLAVLQSCPALEAQVSPGAHMAAPVVSQH